MATQAAPEGGPWASNLFGSTSGPPPLFNMQPDGQPQFRKRAPSMFDTEPDGKPDLRERQLKLFERKPSDPSDPSCSPVEVAIKWDLTREFILYPDGKGGPVKLPSTQHVKRPSPDMVQKLRQGEPEFFLIGCKVTPATNISHEWGYEGSILLYDPKDPADSSVEYVYLTDHLPEQSETRRVVLADPKSNLFFVTLKGDSLPTYHFWQDVKKDGDPRKAEVFDWAAYMDACASRRASDQLDSDTVRISGELHRANDDLEDDEEDDEEDNEEDEIDDAITAMLRGVKRSIRLRDDSSDKDAIRLGRPSRKQRYAPTPKPPPGRVSYDDFFLESDDYEPEGDALHRGLRDLFGSGRYYECPTDRFEYADPEVERLAREFEENLRVEGLEATLRDFGFWQGGRGKKDKHFGGRAPPSEPPKRNWPKRTVLETVAYKLAVASKHTKGLPPLTGDEPWTRDDGLGYWTSSDPPVKPHAPNRLQKQDPTRYRRPTGVTKEKNKDKKMFTGGFNKFRSRFQRAAHEPSYIRPWEQTRWQPNLQVDSDIELNQHLKRLRRRPKKSNLRQTSRSTLSSIRPKYCPSSGRSSEWGTATHPGNSRLAPPGATSFRTRSTRSYPDSPPNNYSPMSDVQPTTDPLFPRSSSSSSSLRPFPTFNNNSSGPSFPTPDSSEPFPPDPDTPSFAGSWWQNSLLHGPSLRRRHRSSDSSARFGASPPSSGTLPSSRTGTSADARAAGPVDEDLHFRDFDGDHTMGGDDAPGLLHRTGRKARVVEFDLPDESGDGDDDDGYPFREIRLRDGGLGADGELPDGSRAFRVWLWAAGAGDHQARADVHESDFWRIAGELLGEGLEEVELRVYDGSVPDTLWLDRGMGRAVFEREVEAWLGGVETDEVYLVPVPEEVESALHKPGDDGEQGQRDVCQVCTQDLAGMPDWQRRHHYRRHGCFPRNSNSSSTDYVPWYTVECQVCGKLLTTPKEYALCYKNHFKGRLGNAVEKHPEVQRELRRMNWRVTCPTCHGDLRGLTRLEWPQHFASHGPTLTSIAKRNAKEKADTARGHGTAAGNVKNRTALFQTMIDQYICSICKKPLAEMTAAQKRQHYNTHVQEGAAMPGKSSTTAEAAADVDATMYEPEAILDDLTEDPLVDLMNIDLSARSVVDVNQDSDSDSTDWSNVSIDFTDAYDRIAGEHYSHEGFSRSAKAREERPKRPYRPHSAPLVHRSPRFPSTGPSGSRPVRSLFPNAPKASENDFDSIFDKRKDVEPRRPKPRLTPRRHRSSSAPPPSSNLAALQSELHARLATRRNSDPFDGRNRYNDDDDFDSNGPSYSPHRRPSIREFLSSCFTGSKPSHGSSTTHEAASALRAEARIRVDIDAQRARSNLPPLTWPPITPAHIASRRASARQTRDAASSRARPAAALLAHEDARLAAAGPEPGLYDAQRHRWHRRTHDRLVEHVRGNAARRARGWPRLPFPDFDTALLAERARERPGAYGFGEGLEHHEARVARRRKVVEGEWGRAHPEWDGGMRRGMIFDEGVEPRREFVEDGEGEGFLDGEWREWERVPGEVVGLAVVVGEEPLPRYPGFDEGADAPAAPTPPPPYRTLFGLRRRNRNDAGGPARSTARVPVGGRGIRRLPDVGRHREQSAATAARARERLYARRGGRGGDGELHRSLASRASRCRPYRRGVAGELHRRVASDPEGEEEEEEEEDGDEPRWLHRRGDGGEGGSEDDDVQMARSSVVPEGLKRDVASGRPVAEIEDEWLEEISESFALSLFWLRLRAALVLDEQLRKESEDERIAREASVVPPEQPLAEGESGVLGEVVDESEARQSQLSLSSSSKRKVKKRKAAGEKTYKPTVEDEDDEAEYVEENAFVVRETLVEEIVSPRDKKPVKKKRKPAGDPDEPWRPSKQARVEEVPEEFEEPEEEKKNKGKRKAKRRGIKKTVTIEVESQPVAEPEAAGPESKGKVAGRKRKASASAAPAKKPAAKTKTTKSPRPKRLSPTIKAKKREDRSGEPSPEPERASEGATKYSLRKR